MISNVLAVLLALGAGQILPSADQMEKSPKRVSHKGIDHEVLSWQHDDFGVHAIVRGDLLPDSNKSDEWHEWVDAKGTPFLRTNIDGTWSRLFASKDWLGRKFRSASEFADFRQNYHQMVRDAPAGGFQGVDRQWFAKPQQEFQSGPGPSSPPKPEASADWNPLAPLVAPAKEQISEWVLKICLSIGAAACLIGSAIIWSKKGGRS